MAKWAVGIITRCVVGVSALRADEVPAICRGAGGAVIGFFEQFDMAAVTAVNPYKNTSHVAIPVVEGAGRCISLR